MALESSLEVSSEGKLSVTIGAKIYGVVGLCLGCMIVVAAVSIWQMSRIGHEIEGIAERDLPLTAALVKVTTHQLEQSISLERALRAGGLKLDSEASNTLYEESLKSFEKLANQVDNEIQQAEQIALMALEAADTEEARVLFAEVDKELIRVAKEHKDFDKHAFELFELAKAGNLDAALQLLPTIQKEEDELTHALEAMMFKVESFTLHAAEVAEAHEKSALWMLMLISVGAVLIGVGLSWFIVRRAISRPLADIIKGLEALSADDLSVDVKVHSNDEIGSVAKAYATFRDALARSKDLEREQEEQKKQNEAENRRNVLRIADRFESSIGEIINSVASASTELSTTAQAMSSISEETNSQASTVAAASEEASSNVQTVATAAEEMSHSVEEINERITSAARSSGRAVEMIKNTGSEMAALSQTAEKITQVIAMISDIADQTNLLALNATIESARAGEAGKGFAVVAGEVKELAGQTAKATQEIISSVEQIQQASTKAIKSMNEVSGAIEEVDEVSTAIATAMEEQRATTQEIARNVHEAATGTQEVSSSITGVTQAAQETGSAATQVTAAAGELSEQSETLKTEVVEFLCGLREGPANRREKDDPDYKGEERRRQSAELSSVA